LRTTESILRAGGQANRSWKRRRLYRPDGASNVDAESAHRIRLPAVRQLVSPSGRAVASDCGRMEHARRERGCAAQGVRPYTYWTRCRPSVHLQGCHRTGLPACRFRWKSLSRVLGGGIVPGSLVLIGGRPRHRQIHIAPAGVGHAGQGRPQGAVPFRAKSRRSRSV